MTYIIECRARDAKGIITGATFRGFGAGLPDKRTANEVFRREVDGGKWDAVYMEKLYSNGTLIDIKEWYK
jgi:hypothetical protein